MDFRVALITVVCLSVLLPGCWKVGAYDADNDACVEDGDTSADASSSNSSWLDQYADLDCADLLPCVSSGDDYYCPGAITGVKCWNMSSHCNVKHLCADKGQACILGCNGPCHESGAEPPVVVCD